MREPIFISVRAHKCRAKRNILLASIDINVLPQIILVYNSCVRAGGRVKARPCHSSLMDVYWKSFPPSDKGNFATAFYIYNYSAGQVLENLFPLAGERARIHWKNYWA
jgi:hypothetical protein